MLKKYTLKNGLRIITIPQEGTQAVTVLALVGTGSKYEKKNISGISHFLEHLFFKGTKKRPTAFKVVEPLDKIGGIYNAFTSEELTGYYAKVSFSQIDSALDWVSDIYLNSLFPVKEIEKERGVIIEEINMYFDTPIMYISELWKSLLYGDQPAGWDIAGTKETVSKITRQQILKYRKSQYVAKNTIICLAGNIKEQEMESKVKNYFSSIAVSRSMQKPRIVERQTVPELLLHTKKTDQTHFYLGVRTYNFLHPQRYALDILAVILGGMMSSRLFTELREKLGLAYYVKVDAESDPDAGYLACKAGVDNKKVEKAITVVLREYKKLAQKKISEKELKKAKDNLKGKLALNLEASDSKAFFYSCQEMLEGKTLKPEEIFSRIDKVSVNDILKTAKDIFRPNKLNLAVVGPFKDKEKFKKLLKI
ncbi:MAG: pitrilysin family protein [Candidatus Nealsonbacteria bacterium]